MLVLLSSLALAAPDAPEEPELTVEPHAWVHIRPEIRVNPSFDASVQDRQITMGSPRLRK